MAKVVQQTLKEFEIVKRFGCLFMNNASNNDTQVSTLADSFGDYCIHEEISKVWNANDSSIQYLSHILNLFVKVFFKSLEEVNVISNNDKIPTNNASNLIQRLHFIVKKLHSNPQQRKQFLG